MVSNNPPDDHHFLPVFYLKRWTKSDGLVEFARRGNGQIEGRPSYPRGTGYLPSLYKDRFESDPVKAQALEIDFMQTIDRKAADALLELEQGSKATWANEPGSDWSRFLLSLLFRVPEELDEFKRSYLEFFNKAVWPDENEYQRRKTTEMPDTLREFVELKRGLVESSGLKTFRTLIDHSGLVQLINSMTWTVFRLPGAKIELLTSDRPVLMTATLSEENAYLLLPIGPRQIFVAGKDKRTIERMRATNSEDKFVRIINSQVVSHAAKYAYSSNYEQLRFIQNRLSTKTFEPLMARLYREMKSNHPRLR